MSFALFASSFAGAREACATVDSLTGAAEVQKSGQQQWRPIALGSKLGNNNIVRARDKSFLRISWPDGATSFVHANSQVLINLYSPPKRTSFPRM